MSLFKKLIFPHQKNLFRPHFLRSKALAFYAFLLILFQFSFPFFFQYSLKETIAATPITAERIYELTNNERIGRGFRPLDKNSLLDLAAYNKGTDMFEDQYWAHNAPDGTTPWDFILGVGYDYLYAGENLAKDFTNSENIVAAWMNSPGHRDNVINENFKDIGLAVVSGDFKGSETTIVVQLFGALFPEEEKEKEENFSPTPTPTPVPISTPVPSPTPTPIPAPSDTIPPSQPQIISPKAGMLLNTSKPVILGLAEGESLVEVFDMGEIVGSVATSGDGSFIFEFKTELAEGGHTIKVRATDKARNKSDFSKEVSFAIDTLPPFIDESSLKIEPFLRFSQVAFRIQVTILSAPVQTIVGLGQYSLILKEEGNNVFSGVFAPPQILLTGERSVVIEAKDKAGNSAYLNAFLPETSALISKNPPAGVLGITTNSFKKTFDRFRPKTFQESIRVFYLLFSLGLIGLLVLDTAYFRLQGIKREGSSHSMAHAMVLGLGLLGILFGNIGTIL